MDIVQLVFGSLTHAFRHVLARNVLGAHDQPRCIFRPDGRHIDLRANPPLHDRRGMRRDGSRAQPWAPHGPSRATWPATFWLAIGAFISCLVPPLSSRWPPNAPSRTMSSGVSSIPSPEKVRDPNQAWYLQPRFSRHGPSCLLPDPQSLFLVISLRFISILTFQILWDSIFAFRSE